MAQQNVMQNPYGAPRAVVGDTEQQYQPVRIFAVSGRIGRARYILYSFVFSMLIIMAMGALSPFVGRLGIVATGLALMAFIFMLTIQRSHDFNMTGWFSLLSLVPLVNLLFWFIPGTDGANRYGAPTPPNSMPVLIALWIFPALFVAGIAAAIVIPALTR